MAVTCLVLAAAAPVAAYTPPDDHQKGQIGHYDFRDYHYDSHDGNVDCNYENAGNGKHRIKKFVLRTPRIWWPDTGPGTHEHGTVGWRYRIQKTTDPDDVAWSTVYTSSIQKKTAYEDHPGYDDADKAVFTPRGLNWSNTHNVYYRIKYTIYYYRSNGTVKGQLDHWYTAYDTDFGPDPAVGYCNNVWHI